MKVTTEQLRLNSIDCKTFWVTEKGAFGETSTMIFEYDELCSYDHYVIKEVLTAINNGKSYCNPKHTSIIEVKWD